MMSNVYVSFTLQTTGMTPLMYAVKENRTSIIDRLIELGCDVCARNLVSGARKLLSYSIFFSLCLHWDLPNLSSVFIDFGTDTFNSWGLRTEFFKRTALLLKCTPKLTRGQFLLACKSAIQWDIFMSLCRNPPPWFQLLTVIVKFIVAIPHL
jgi:ankyrin repeat protein